MPTNLNIISELKKKKEEALSQLYDQYSSAIYAVILKMVRKEDEAQDLLQDTFLTVWNKAHQYDESKGNFYTWVYRIARNKALNHIRSQKNFIQNEDLSVYKYREEEEKNDLDISTLKGKFDILKPHHKRAIDLVFFKGLTHREAYKEMDVPLGTFKSYIRQALKELKTQYKTLILVLYLIINALG